MYEQAGYGTLIGRIRDNVRTLIRKQIELPKQEVTELVQANLRAAKLFGIALAFGIMFLVSFVVLLVALIAWLLAIWLPYVVAVTLSAFLVVLILAGGAGLFGWWGYKALVLRGPKRSIESFKETVNWAKARLLGQTES